MLGIEIKRFRKDNDYSQKDIAEMLGVSVRSIMRWEQDKTKPNNEELQKLAELLQMSEEDLLRDNRDTGAAAPNTLEKISDNIDNLVTGQERINTSITDGREEFRERQEELIQELQKQNQALMNKLEESERKNDCQKEILRQRKIRNIILVIFLGIVIVLLVLLFIYHATYGYNPNEQIYADDPVAYRTN